MKVRQLAAVMAVSAATTIGTIYGYNEYQQNHQPAFNTPPSSSIFKNTGYTGENAVSGPMVDFEKAATKAAPAVVHIKTLTKSKQVAADPNMQDNPFKDFFGDGFGDMFGGRG